MTSDVILYHFTCQENLSDILVDGFLEPSESLISRNKEHAGPDVVWLTSSPSLPRVGGEDAANRMDLVGSQFDKTAIRFTVRLHKRSVFRWRKWAESRGIERSWADTIASSGVNTKSWWVVEGRVLREQWTEIRDMRTDQVYLSAGQNGFEYSKPLGYDFDPQYTQADIDEAYRRALYESGERFDLPQEWLDESSG